MASLTLKGIPEELLEELRASAEEERRSLNQQAIYILEQTLLLRRRHSFRQLLEEFYVTHGPPITKDAGEGAEWDDVRSDTTGRDVDL